MMNDDALRHWEIIAAPPGAAWSGRARYAAAMHFFQHGEMTAEVLEIYRTCARLDAEDPLLMMDRHGVGADWIERVAARRRGSGA